MGTNPPGGAYEGSAANKSGTLGVVIYKPCGCFIVFVSAIRPCNADFQFFTR
jgi:hypothetical protein